MNNELMKECLTVVDELNTYVSEILGVENIHSFIFETDGYHQYIAFDDHILWESVDDPREWDDVLNEYEDLEKFIKKEFNEYVRQLYKLKFLDV